MLPFHVAPRGSISQGDAQFRGNKTRLYFDTSTLTIGVCVGVFCVSIGSGMSVSCIEMGDGMNTWVN